MATSERKRLILTVIAVSLVGIITGRFWGGSLLPFSTANELFQYNENTLADTTVRHIVHAHDGISQHEHMVTTVVSTTETTPHGYFHNFEPANQASGTAATSTGSSSGRGANEVWIVGSNFVPWTVTVPVGTKITWINKSTQAHTITSDSGLFDEPLRFFGDSFSYTFTSRGVFSYHCTPHTATGMIGKVIVE